MWRISIRFAPASGVFSSVPLNAEVSRFFDRTEAITGLPAHPFDEGGKMIGQQVLVRTDSAGASSEF